MTEWIFPSNLKRFRSDLAMKANGAVEWYQNKTMANVALGDVVFLYISSPHSKLLWMCDVLKTHETTTVLDDDQFCVDGSTERVPGWEYIYLNGNTELSPFAPLLDYYHLKQHGLRSRLMGPQKVSPELSAYIHSVIGTPDISSLLSIDAAQTATHNLRIIAKQHSTNTPRVSTAQVQQIYRDPYIAEYAKRIANGICQLCGCPAPFLDQKGKPYLESHHIQWLSQGGADSIDSTVKTIILKPIHVISS